ncbi:MAG: efflux RND transporter permease subunit, partial [Thermoleophilia bacterium]|nr:efflux RND transporter permease subunit [Thermoleophilia bacterium]
MRGIVRWCLDRKSVVILATIIILVAGAFGATQLRQQLFPDINFPFLLTTVDTSGLGADAVDTEVSQKLAAAAKLSDKVEAVTTVSSPGSARMYVQYSFGSDTKSETRDLQDRIKALQLPAGSGEAKIKGGFSSQASVVASIAAPDGNLQKLQPRVLELKQQLEDIDGVSRVELSGISTPEYHILVTKQ